VAGSGGSTVSKGVEGVYVGAAGASVHMGADAAGAVITGGVTMGAGVGAGRALNSLT